MKIIKFKGNCGWSPQSPSFASIKRSAAQTLVMKIRIQIKALQRPTHRNLPTKPIITHIQILQIQFRHRRRQTPKHLIMINIQRCQALRKRDLRQVKFQQIPRQIKNLDHFVSAEEHKRIAFKLIAGEINGSEVQSWQRRRDVPRKLIVWKNQRWGLFSREVAEGIRDLSC